MLRKFDTSSKKINDLDHKTIKKKPKQKKEKPSKINKNKRKSTYGKVKIKAYVLWVVEHLAIHAVNSTGKFFLTLS